MSIGFISEGRNTCLWQHMNPDCHGVPLSDSAVCAYAQEHGAALLSRCESAAALAEVEAAVKGAIHAWQRGSLSEVGGALQLLLAPDIYDDGVFCFDSTGSYGLQCRASITARNCTVIHEFRSATP